MRNLISRFLFYNFLFLSCSCHVKLISMDLDYVPNDNDINEEDDDGDVSSDELGMSLAEDESEEAARLIQAKPHLVP